jgi:hypothetical protein
MADPTLPRYPLASPEPAEPPDTDRRAFFLRLVRYGLVAGVVSIFLLGAAIGLTSGFAFWFVWGDW